MPNIYDLTKDNEVTLDPKALLMKLKADLPIEPDGLRTDREDIMARKRSYKPENLDAKGHDAIDGASSNDVDNPKDMSLMEQSNRGQDSAAIRESENNHRASVGIEDKSPETKQLKDNLPALARRKMTSELMDSNVTEKKTTTEGDKAPPSQTPSPTSSPVQLKREVSLIDGIGMIVGLIIGSGIFISPGIVVRYTGSVGMSLSIWIATGVMCMIGALCYAELGTMIPKCGGTYSYILEAFGPVPAFLTIWISQVIDNPGNIALSLMTFTNYLLQPIFPDCQAAPYLAQKFIGLVLLGFLNYINFVGIKMGTRVQNTLSLTKTFALIIIIVVGAVYVAQGGTENYRDPMRGSNYDPSSIATAFFSTLFTYGGWDGLNYVVEELKDPYKNLPRAIIISLTIITVIYALTNAAYFAVLSPYEVLSSSAVAVTFSNRTLGVMAWIMPLLVAASTFGALNGRLIIQSRLAFAGARSGQLPRCFRLIHVKNRTPVVSIIGMSILPIIVLFVPDVGDIINFTGFAGKIISLLGISALLWFRYKEPERPRPIKPWIGLPILYALVCFCQMVLAAINSPFEIVGAFAVYAIGLLVYYVVVHRKSKVIDAAMEKLELGCQKLFVCVDEEKEKLSPSAKGNKTN